MAYLTAVYFDHGNDSSKPPTFFSNSNLVLIKMFAEKFAIIITESPTISYIFNFSVMTFTLVLRSGS